MNLSPRRLLGDSLEAAARASPFELRPMDAGHRCQSGDMEHITDAVLRILRCALCVGHGTNLPRQVTALKTKQNKTYGLQEVNCKDLSYHLL